MSEKRFKLIKPLGTRLGLKDIFIKDTVNDWYYNEKEQVVVLLNEQQATIRKLQDLCGQSDSENARLRIENEKLRKELGDCEKFRYTTFKRMRDVLDE